MIFKYITEIDKKDNHKYITITGSDQKKSHLVIPETIDNLPVEAIGNHAFSGRDDICSVTIPDTVKTLYAFAFHNCRNLKKITLTDSIDDYYDGVIRQCDSLTDIEITVKRGWYEVIRNFLADSDKTLRFLIHKKDLVSCLTFPEYVYDFAENTMARTIQFSIGGSGMVYRECVDRRSINYREYDRLFEKAVIDGNTISEDIAIGRVLFPYDLDEGYRIKYSDFIKKNAKNIAIRLIEAASKSTTQNNDNYLDKLSSSNLLTSLIPYFDDDTIDFVIQLTSQKKLTLLSASLIASAKKGTPSPNEFSF